MSLHDQQQRALAEFEKKLIEGAPVLDKFERAMCLNFITSLIARTRRETAEEMLNPINQMDMRGNTNTEVVEAVTATLTSMKEGADDR